MAASPTGRLFVVQKHAARNLHYDFRLELNGVLKSWAVPKGPSLDPGQKPLAVHVEDHPIEYGSFEGIIPEDEYGGGTVMLWDGGEWEPIDDPEDGFARGDLKFRLHGEKLRGAWVLARMRGDAGEGGRNWLLIKKKDEASRPVAQFNVLAEYPFSVASGRTLEQIAAAPERVWTDGRAQPVEAGAARPTPAASDLPEASALAGARAAPLPETFEPQLCGTSTRPPAGDAWVHEVKLDGYRLICRLDHGDVRLLTRNGHDWTHVFPAVARAAGRLPVDDAILDGEVVVLDAKGMPDFGALQNALRGPERHAFTYYLFDVPHACGHDLTRVPLTERKRFLAALLEAAPMVAPTLQLCPHLEDEGAVVFEHAARLGLEGIISKRADAPYVSRRSDTWLKIKHRLRQELVVGGYTDPSGGRTGFGALLVGYHDEEGRLVYCGRAGSGFREATLARLEVELARRGRRTSPFVNAEMDPDANRGAHWVRPDLVVEVEFTAWTKEGLLRHPVFIGVREDVDPREVVLESAAPPPPPAPTPARPPRSEVIEAPPSPDDGAVAGVRISNPERPVYPEDRVTKRDVAEYYARVADRMLPHVARRPLSLVRCPLGLAGDSFYQRHLGEGFPSSIRGIASGEKIEGEPYLLIDDVTGLVALAQMGVLEIHTWGCREDDLERPDHLVLDLDPGPGIEWADVAASGHFVRRYLDDLGLRSFVKTSGGKGLHVVVPIVRRAGWEEAKAFAHGMAKDMVRLAPRNFVATVSKAFRNHRVFIDYLRNTRGATAVAPYSTRARPGACVSTPLAWDELAPDRPPSAFTVRTVPARVAGGAPDAWEGFRRVRQSITAARKRAVGLT